MACQLPTSRWILDSLHIEHLVLVVQERLIHKTHEVQKPTIEASKNILCINRKLIEVQEYKLVVDDTYLLPSLAISTFN